MPEVGVATPGGSVAVLSRLAAISASSLAISAFTQWRGSQSEPGPWRGLGEGDLSVDPSGVDALKPDERFRSRKGIHPD